MEELIKTLEEIKEHQMQTVHLARTTTVYKLADKAIKQALSLGAVSKSLPVKGKDITINDMDKIASKIAREEGW